MEMRNELLKKATEGKLFIHRWTSVFMSQSVFYSEDYYVIRNGVVYFINRDLSESESKDDVLSTAAECECLGDYDVSKIKREKFTYISYKKIKKMFIEKTQ
jgi:hypothetical protein